MYITDQQTCWALKETSRSGVSHFHRSMLVLKEHESRVDSLFVRFCLLYYALIALTVEDESLFISIDTNQDSAGQRWMTLGIII